MITKFVEFSKSASIFQHYIKTNAAKRVIIKNHKIDSNSKPLLFNYKNVVHKFPDVYSSTLQYKLPERISFNLTSNVYSLNNYIKHIEYNVDYSHFNNNNFDVFNCSRTAMYEPKNAPSFRHSKIIEDPNSNSQIIKVTLPHLITIRRHKMKKHKRKKWIRKILFVLRKRRLLKEKRREKEIIDYIQAQEQRAQIFDAEKLIELQLNEARSTGWGIDILSERYAKLKLENDNKS